MDISHIWIIVSIVALAVISVFVFRVGKNRSENRLTPLASLAFLLVLAGILFGDNRIIGYGLIGMGVILAVLDIYNRSKRI